MKRAVSILVLCSMLMVTVAGCGSGNKDPLMSESKETLVNTIREYEQQIVADSDTINELQGKLDSSKEVNNVGETISEFSDGTGRMTLHSFDQIIELPTPFTTPFSTQAPNNTSVIIGDSLTIKPSENWVLGLSGTIINMEHTSGISGIINTRALDTTLGKLDNDGIAAYLGEEFIKTIPQADSAQPTLSKVYVGNNHLGYSLSTSTYVDEENGQMLCGIIKLSTKLTMQFMFYYPGDKDAAKDELIVSLLSTIKQGNQVLKVGTA